MISKRAALVFASVALVAGALLSLALRPPGGGGGVAATVSKQGVPVRIHWRVPLSAPRSLPGSGETPKWLAEALHEASGGAVRLDLYDPGEIVPAFAVADAVRDRKVQAGFTWLGYDQGKMPASALFGATPFGLDPWAFIGWWHFADGKALAEGIYAEHNIKPLFCGISGPETAGWFRSPLNSTEDLSGLKIRFAGLGGKVMQRVGASVTMLPAGEIFQALDTGVIDATEFSQPITDKALGFSRIAKYNYYPGWHQPFSATHFVVNLGVWNALPPEDRSLIEAVCLGSVGRSLGLSEHLQGPVVAEFPELGVSANTIPEELLRVLRAGGGGGPGRGSRGRCRLQGRAGIPARLPGRLSGMAPPCLSAEGLLGMIVRRGDGAPWRAALWSPVPARRTVAGLRARAGTSPAPTNPRRTAP